MMFNGRLELESGFVFDYANMLGRRRIQSTDFTDMQDKITMAGRS